MIHFKKSYIHHKLSFLPTFPLRITCLKSTSSSKTRAISSVATNIKIYTFTAYENNNLLVDQLVLIVLIARLCKTHCEQADQITRQTP